MDHLIKNGYATVFDSVETLAEIIKSPVKRIDTQYFFKPNSVENIVNELKQIRENVVK